MHSPAPGFWVPRSRASTELELEKSYSGAAGGNAGVGDRGRRSRPETRGLSTPAAERKDGLPHAASTGCV